MRASILRICGPLACMVSEGENLRIAQSCRISIGQEANASSFISGSVGFKSISVRRKSLMPTGGLRQRASTASDDRRTATLLHRSEAR